MANSGDLSHHLGGGITTVCRCWRLQRRDGVVHAFTDHDMDLVIGGDTYRASVGMSARAIEQSSGLAVDNSEALGVLSDPGISEDHIASGRLDGARVEMWLVNWQRPDERMRQFRGTIGEIVRAGKAFRAELRGLAETLNQNGGRIFQASCSAVLGDTRCKVDLDDPAFRAERSIANIASGRFITLEGLDGFAEGWFERGRLEVLSGDAAGEVAIVKSDRSEPGRRTVELRESLSRALSPGDTVRLEAGCDKRAETCRQKFDNMLNYRGFPHLPGDNWLMAYPTSSGRNDGGSLKS